MKKTIKGKCYNTETAIFLAEYETSHPRNDFRYFKQKLYQKKTGEFFIWSEDHFAKQRGFYSFDGTPSYGERIFTVTLDNAKEWVQNYAKNRHAEIFEACRK